MTDVTLPSLATGERHALYHDFVRVLAAIHRVDWQALDLAGFGKPERYVARNSTAGPHSTAPPRSRMTRLARVAFRRRIADQGVWRERIAESRVLIDQARLLTLEAAHLMDRLGNKAAAAKIAMIKIVAPSMACRVIDWAIQACGGGGVSEDFPLAAMYANARALRIADGPDEVHRNHVAKLELSKYSRAVDGAASIATPVG